MLKEVRSRAKERDLRDAIPGRVTGPLPMRSRGGTCISRRRCVLRRASALDIVLRRAFALIGAGAVFRSVLMYGGHKGFRVCFSI